jgi:PadR family transcriptional regulator, regulatory protein PadR
MAMLYTGILYCHIAIYMISKALIAASLKPIMLSLLSSGEAYGYEIIQRIGDLSDGKLQWTAGTLYPVLHRMEAEGLVEPVWRASESGPRRKYYRLTPRGRKALETEKRQWLDVHAVLLKLWGPEFSPAVSG